jgi:phthiocerol/phenolphthiocerol synthesis type-I polyketide synthase C
MSTEQLVEELRAYACEHLDLPAGTIGPDNDLFEFGFDSILVLELVWHIDERYGVRLGARDLFATPTVASIAALVQAGLEEPA